MDNRITNISLVHYMYFPAVDHMVIKEAWDKLVKIYRLTGSNAGEVLIDGKTLSHFSPIVLKNKHIAIGLLITKGVTIIELLFLQEDTSLPEHIKELENLREQLSGPMDHLAGETTVIIIKDLIQNISPDRLTGPLSEKIVGENELNDITLYDIQSTESARRYCAVYSRDKGKQTNFLVSTFPAIDAILFKLAKQTAYFRDQRKFINNKKRDADLSLSDILNHWTEARTSTGRNIDHLENDVEKLSRMYSELVGNLKLVKKAHDTTSRDLDRLQHHLRNLNADPVMLANFVAARTSEYSNLLSDLELDDKFLHRSLDDTRATIEVVRTRIELERSRESFLLQQEGVSVQTAAGFIELFVVWFYTLEAWELLASKEVFEHIAIGLRLGIDTMFAIAVVAFTHYAAKLIRKERSNLGLSITGLNIVVALVLMMLVTSYAAKG